MKRVRLAVIVTHPIQYYAPLYQRLARRDDLELKVFFTWHRGAEAVADRGFGRDIAWDIPLTDGYESEHVENRAWRPGDHHFFGLVNPGLMGRVMAWKPDAAHVTGWAYYSHARAIRELARAGVPTLFRGDSHLLDGGLEGPRWWLKRTVLEKLFAWPAACLFAGKANRDYFEAFGVQPERLFPCPHSIDVARFAGGADEREREAARWRLELGIPENRIVVLFAGKFERKKRPLEVMRAFQAARIADCVMLMVGGGELADGVRALAAAAPESFRVLPFQNQSRMPLVYRLGDALLLASARNETWGLSVNEAMACGRPVIVSDRVGCSADLVDERTGRVFPWHDLGKMAAHIAELGADRVRLAEMGRAAKSRAAAFDLAHTEEALITCLQSVCPS